MPDATPYDTGNPLFGPTQMNLTCTVGTAPDGTEVMFITIRSSSTTVTAILDKDFATKWAMLLTRAADQMSGLQVAKAMPFPPIQGPS